MGVSKERNFDTVAITPGTQFMSKLSKSIREEFNDSKV